MAMLLAPDFVLGGSAKAVSARFEDSVAQAFGSPPAAAMVAEGDFVASVVAARTRAAIGVDIDVFGFPTEVRGQPVVVGGGDVAVQLRASPAASALMLFLASPEAAAIWAAAGGFLSPNLDLDLSVYPDPLTRSIARALVEAGDNLRFDLSDLQPAGFGAPSDTGLQGELRSFLRTHDLAGTQQRLELAASAAFSQPDR
ncbi:MAG: alpha-glucoside transport system substrate-binding protein [Pseudonocardiales bacterium]|jgi:ABC-type glycerol-3-phosphate transport system substrate-binding protein|nr:alpha-glucoside transport system substrate-binding protein [Pseudonocardiales bacterium]